MKRAALYARYSTDLQSDRSVDDQFRICREHAARIGASVVQTYSDAAKSGASMLGRDGVLQMMEDAKAGRFDVIITEALDRLSRDMEDLAAIHKRLRFYGVQIVAINEGLVNTMLVGLRGLIGQMQREDGVEKIKRGLSGRVKDGLHAGGRAYGYRPTVQKGRPEIVPEEAATIQRIFEWYAAGISARNISGRLNAEGVPPPRGQRWNASTLNGNRQRGNGILSNELYLGRLVWNKVRMIKNPETGRRVSRPNADHVTRDAPDLRIISDELWQAVQARREEARHGNHKPFARKKYPLSGLLKCGECGGGLAVKDISAGRVRVQCATYRESRSCTQSKALYLDRIEAAVVAELSHHLSHPALLKEFVASYNHEMKRLASGVSDELVRQREALAVVERDLERAVDLLISGTAPADILRSRIAGLEVERDRLRRLTQAKPSARLIRLQPNLVEMYRGVVSDVAGALRQLGENAPVQQFRELIGGVRVSVHPAASSYVVEISAKIAAVAESWGSDGSGGPLPSDTPIFYLIKTAA